MSKTIIGINCVVSQWLTKFAAPVVDLAARIYVGLDFFRSGLTKIDSWDTTLTLFEYEYAVPVLPVNVAAVMATAGELILPVLLFLGLFTRLGALGLFVMALVIELFVYPNTAQHYYWMIILGFLATYGANKISLDHWLTRNK